MRPTGIEALRAVQTALTEVIGPELQTAFAQDTAQMSQMLLESVIAEMDGAASDLLKDNDALAGLLEDFRAAASASANTSQELSSAIKESDGALARPDAASMAINELAARNKELRAALETAVQALEGVIDDSAFEPLAPVRAAMYRHLREVAGRGWSFWDAASFREYMTKHRSERTA